MINKFKKVNQLQLLTNFSSPNSPTSSLQLPQNSNSPSPETPDYSAHQSPHILPHSYSAQAPHRLQHVSRSHKIVDLDNKMMNMVNYLYILL